MMSRVFTCVKLFVNGLYFLEGRQPTESDGQMIDDDECVAPPSMHVKLLGRLRVRIHIMCYHGTSL